MFQCQTIVVTIVLDRKNEKMGDGVVTGILWDSRFCTKRR